jgi:hypothetical protein
LVTRMRMANSNNHGGAYPGHPDEVGTTSGR